MVLPAPRMPQYACVGLMGVLDFNVVTFVMALIIFCSPDSTGLALYSLVVFLFGLVVGVGLWVLWPRCRALLSLLGLIWGASPACSGLLSSRLVCPASPPAAVAVEPALSAPATADVSGVLFAASVSLDSALPTPACPVVLRPAPVAVDLALPAPKNPDVPGVVSAVSVGFCPALPATSCPVVLSASFSPMEKAVKPAASVESVAPAVVSAGAVLPSPVVMPAASGADVPFACVVLPGDKIPIFFSSRGGKVFKKPWSRKLCRQIARTDLASLGVERPATPMSIDDSLETIAADVSSPFAAMEEDVMFSSCSIWIPASADVPPPTAMEDVIFPSPSGVCVPASSAVAPPTAMEDVICLSSDTLPAAFAGTASHHPFAASAFSRSPVASRKPPSKPLASAPAASTTKQADIADRPIAIPRRRRP
ncbi:hypothetical protein [Parasitella parasitica]|uniref:Uncharacterized protein n=1 Tax=Parasitella parasitica TaxID=35722 RepID=A0A0B7N3S1_9FUNG|nr:hypothetical protein [Parasitella parasitica]